MSSDENVNAPDLSMTQAERERFLQDVRVGIVAVAATAGRAPLARSATSPSAVRSSRLTDRPRREVWAVEHDDLASPWRAEVPIAQVLTWES